jgi:histidine phosphotransferase ChpT
MNPTLSDDGGADALRAMAESLTTRLCHDVAGLVGTLSGTLELVMEAVPPEDEAAELALAAARQLAARIRLFRAAWGGGDMADASLDALAEGLSGRTRWALDLSAIDAAAREKPAGDGAAGSPALAAGGARLLLCLLLAAGSAVPTGGSLIAAPDAAGGFTLTMTGKNAAWPAALGAPPAAGHPAAEDAKGVAISMAGLLAAGAGWRLGIAGETLRATPG